MKTLVKNEQLLQENQQRLRSKQNEFFEKSKQIETTKKQELEDIKVYSEIKSRHIKDVLRKSNEIQKERSETFLQKQKEE